MQSSLKPHAAACSGHSAVIPPPHQGTWVPLYRHLSPCSPAAASTGAAKARPPPSLADLLRQDQLRVDHIHMRLLSSSSQGVRVSKQKQGPVKEPVRSEVIHLHDQPVIQVTIGSERKGASGGSGGSGDQQQSQAAGVVQTVVLDTASDVPWVQCHPLASSATTDSSSSSYDPARSSTYYALACNSAACTELGRLYRGACVNNQCQYRVPIPSSPASSSSSGTYGSDLLKLTADPADGASMSFKFGCSHGEAKQGGEGSIDNATAGIMALGGGPESLVSQNAAMYGSAFSYCIPATESRRPGFFVLGGGVGDLSGAGGYAVTPMLRYARVPTLYRVRLLAIAVDGQQLNVTPSVFASGSVLDSRTAITRLPPTAYQALREAFRSRMAMYREAPPQGNLDTCYDFAGAFLVMVPRVALLLDGNAVVALDRQGILFHDCLVFTSNTDDRMPGILGNVQQQTMEVLYNVGGVLISMIDDLRLQLAGCRPAGLLQATTPASSTQNIYYKFQTWHLLFGSLCCGKLSS
ncbi:hypothetical protein BDA96_10G017200 [Sorghum bicolor]|uniref:Peptidase A1 domain-containing protein n=2 Tax=Sorghum bicolor TaxID=4558 RepID=A0A921PWK2_SORBI|nr:hypothetical protein SORBI_3010G014600 [Sorghum bicolor]KAG0512479.1 hypothetical protein BDA96_10G017200 [Sorghum bicolor]